MLPEGVRVRMLHAVYGDPRAAAEAVPRLTERQTSGHDPLPTDPAELAPALLHAHRAEIRALPDDTRLLLLLAAADQYPLATHAFLRATAAARLDTRPLEWAEAAGIAHAGAGGVVFRDAWTRIAAYETGSPADRRDVHRLLARVLRADGETPRRSWHRGAGALGPSGRLTSELRAAADQARTAGQLTLARALMERAATLCPDRTETARLLARAATDAWHAGDGDRARRLAATAAEDDALAGLFALRAGNATEAFDALVAAAVQRGGGGEGRIRGNGSAASAGGGEAASAEGVTTATGSGLGGIGGRPSASLGGGSATASVLRPAERGPEAPAPGQADRVSSCRRIAAPLPGQPGGADRGVEMPDRPDSAVHLLARAAEAAVYTGDLRRCREAVQVAGRLGVGPPGALGGLAAAVEGRYEDARELLRTAAGHRGPGGDPTLLVHAGIAALMLGDHTLAATATVRAVSSARARGATATVAQALEFRAYADFWTGRPHAGAATALDALRQAHATGQDNGACHLQAALAMFAALTGDEDTCRERAAAARSYALTHGLGLPAALAQWALAYLDLAAGRFAGAAARLRALAGFGPGHGHRAIRHLATPHYVEAAARTGDTRVARAAHADYDRWASAVRSPDDLALSARCRALLAPGAEAVEHYRAALDLHAHGTRDFERARTELLFGSALRRLRRRTEARDRLNSALEAFDSFGAPHCATQARAELRALGAPATPAHGGAADPTTRLTAQQLLIARMAADGATNREIAACLALSPRTIDHHLRGVFTRLGIRSRIDLVRLLGGGGGVQGTG
ncbi:helix-turn-helix transcriptional regulator [Streptomyces pseudovenezuelae]|uniref:DNA-binding CsgD family transcriptional regulator n=1 Tax=Streptomyces pseudovenezuelae TaxID=67350 RepID=A0ABT6LPG8_9ACTN|nr:LuxR family transcriptional regulator [Streptomyces pseudovenezuelae]MDH6218190.1 DNA-binding CsgD family transcriptional regulator [Streptomyces pseudovenezuelae]